MQIAVNSVINSGALVKAQHWQKMRGALTKHMLLQVGLFPLERGMPPLAVVFNLALLVTLRFVTL